jgi:hypothetical protein
MSDEIYINTGTSFQQQYTARQPAIGTAPTIANKDAQGNTNVQTPFTFQGRTPVIYQSTVNVQTTYQANTQSPYAYQANAQSQLSANKQTPYPYIANKQNTYQHQANIQTTYQYQANARTPSIGQARQPNTYPIAQNQGQQPYIANKQNPYPYIANANVQTPYPANSQQPYPYIANAQQPYPYQASKQNPYPANAQQPYPYIANARQPSSYQNQNQIAFQQPTSGRTPLSGTTPVIYDGVDGDTTGFQHQNNPWGPGNTNRIHVTQGQSQAQGLSTAQGSWATQRQVQRPSQSGAQATCEMDFRYQTSGSNANKVKVGWFSVDSSAIGPVYEDYIDVYSPIDSSWSIDVKWNSTAIFEEATGGGAVFIPSDSAMGNHAKNTWHNVWDGSSETTQYFRWNSNAPADDDGSFASFVQTGTTIQVRLTKTGETTLYSNVQGLNQIKLGASCGSGAFK